MGHIISELTFVWLCLGETQNENTCGYSSFCSCVTDQGSFSPVVLTL